MKIRYGFVSNSSSSSFTCPVCEETFTGWDGDYGGYGTVYCDSCGETFCEDCLDGPKQSSRIYKKIGSKACLACLEENDNKDCEAKEGDRCPGKFRLDEFDLKWEGCPTCNLEIITSTTIANYVEKEYKISREDAFAPIKQANKHRKKLYDFEYITFACVQLGKTSEDFGNEIREKFKTLEELQRFIRSK